MGALFFFEMPQAAPAGLLSVVCHQVFFFICGFSGHWPATRFHFSKFWLFALLPRSKWEKSWDTPFTVDSSSMHGSWNNRRMAYHGTDENLSCKGDTTQIECCVTDTFKAHVRVEPEGLPVFRCRFVIRGLSCDSKYKCLRFLQHAVPKQQQQQQPMCWTKRTDSEALRISDDPAIQNVANQLFGVEQVGRSVATTNRLHAVWTNRFNFFSTSFQLLFIPLVETLSANPLHPKAHLDGPPRYAQLGALWGVIRC